MCSLHHHLYVSFVADEDVRRYCENQKKKADPPLQVPEVDSCVHRTPGITLEDQEGQDLHKSEKKNVFVFEISRKG